MDADVPAEHASPLVGNDDASNADEEPVCPHENDLNESGDDSEAAVKQEDVPRGPAPPTGEDALVTQAIHAQVRAM